MPGARGGAAKCSGVDVRDTLWFHARCESATCDTTAGVRARGGDGTSREASGAPSVVDAAAVPSVSRLL